MKHIIIIFISVLSLHCLLSQNVVAQAPFKISYQGVLTYTSLSNGKSYTMKNGYYSLRFDFYNSSVGGTLLCSYSTPSTVKVTKGVYEVIIGEDDNNDWGVLECDFSNLRWLQVVVVNGPEKKVTYPYFLPRVQLTSVPYAMGLAENSVNSATIDNASIRNVDLDPFDTFNFGQLEVNVLRIPGGQYGDVLTQDLLGGAAWVPPPVEPFKKKKLTGTTAGTQGASVNVAHGLNDSKILSIDVLVEYSPNSYIHQGMTSGSGFHFNWVSSNGNINIANVAGNSAFILSKPIKILVTYEE